MNSVRDFLSGFLWGLIACACYDAFRLPTIYVAHWWDDFFGTVGGWATGSESNFFVGYLWRYVGDGGGIAVSFFALAATVGAAAWPRRQVLALAIGYAVCPVWTGLVLTDLLAPAGRQSVPADIRHPHPVPGRAPDLRISPGPRLPGQPLPRGRLAAPYHASGTATGTCSSTPFPNLVPAT